MTAAGDWPDPIRLSRADTLSPFPFDALPDFWREWVEAVAASLQVSPEMAFGFSLGAIASVIGGRVWISMKPEWTEGTNLNVGVVAKPGERKSPTQSLATAPVREYEEILIQSKSAEIARARAHRERLGLECDRAKSVYRTAKGDVQKQAGDDYERARAELEAAPEVVTPRIIVGDTTPEQLLELLAEQDGKLAMLADEDTLIGHLCGRYSANPAMEAYLSAYSNAPIVRDRKGKPPVRVARPALTISVPIQPGLLANAFGNTAITGRGLMDRFILLCPEQRVGSREIDTPEIPAHIRDAYRDAVLRIAARCDGQEITLRLSREARERFRRWWAMHERDLGPAGRLAPVQGWGAKGEGRCLRIAALLHIAEHVGPGAEHLVDGLAMERAIKIMGALSEHALAAADVVGTDLVLANARAIIRWALESGPVFTVRDVQHNFAARFSKADNVRAAVRLLVQHNLVRGIAPVAGPKGGRPAEAYEVSPRAREVLSVSSSVVRSNFEDLPPSLSSLASPPRANDTTDITPESFGEWGVS